MKTAFALTLLSVYCAATAGAQETLWTYAPPAGCVDTSPALGDLNGDGRVEIVLGTTAGLIVALDVKGKEIWRQEMRGPICFPPSVADVTGDPAPEVLAMNRQGEVVCLKGSTGDVLWKITLPGSLQW